ncbi:hypothetical protein [Anabaena sp. CCY 9402-a]|uniref:hypothetical protein n=1 Tax=Anabaena sp. CCY 9402-a TaxID=3103867 RepID=UPI0039C71E61
MSSALTKCDRYFVVGGVLSINPTNACLFPNLTSAIASKLVTQRLKAGLSVLILAMFVDSADARRECFSFCFKL